MPPRLDTLTKCWSTFDLPVLPFLAPRIFKPWPSANRRVRRVHSDSVQQTHRCEENYNESPGSPNLQGSLLGLTNSIKVSNSVVEAVDPSTQPSIDSARSSNRPDQTSEAFADGPGAQVLSETFSEEENDFKKKYEEIWGPSIRKRPIVFPTNVPLIRRVQERDRHADRIADVGEQSRRVVRGGTTHEATGQQTSTGVAASTSQDGDYSVSPKRCPSLASIRRIRPSDNEPRVKRDDHNAKMLRRNFQPRKPHSLLHVRSVHKGEREAIKRPRRMKFVRHIPSQESFFTSCSSVSWHQKFAAIKMKQEKCLSRRAERRLWNDHITSEKYALLQQLIAHDTSETLHKTWKNMAHGRKIRIWPYLMLTSMRHHPGEVYKVLEATYQKPFPPSYAVSDSLDFVVSHYLQEPNPDKEDRAVILMARVACILQNGVRDYVNLSQNSIHRILSNLPLEHVKAWYTTLKELGHPLHANTLMNFATRICSSNTPKDAFEVLYKLKASGVDFNSHKVLSMFTALLNRDQRGTDASQIDSGIFDLMLKLGVGPNIITYNVLMRNSLKDGDPTTAWQIFQLMKSNGIDPDAYTYSHLLNDSKNRMDSEDIKRVIGLVQEEGLQNPHIFTDVLHAIFLISKFEAIDPSSHESFSRQKPPFESMLPVYCEYFGEQSLAQFIPDFETRYSHVERPPDSLSKPTPSAHTLMVMFTAYLADVPTCQLVEEFYANFRALEMTSSPCVVSLHNSTRIWNVILESFGRFQGGIPGCMAVIGDMLSSVTQLESQTSGPSNMMANPGDSLNSNESGGGFSIHASATAFSDAGDPPAVVPGLYPEVDLPTRISPPGPDVFTWSVLLKILMHHRQPRAAEKVLSMMQERGIKPNHVTWSTLAWGYARMQLVGGTVNTVHRMEDTGLAPDEYIIGAIDHLRDRRSVIEALKRKQPLNVDPIFIDELREEVKKNEEAEEIIRETRAAQLPALTAAASM